MKIIRTQQPIPEEEDESEDNLPPPPPPPGSPPPHLWPPRIKQPPVNNIHPSLPGNVYPPNPYPPQQVMYPAAYPAPGPQQVPVVMGHAPPPPPQGPRHHHPPGNIHSTGYMLSSYTRTTMHNIDQPMNYVGYMEVYVYLL